MTGNTKTGHLTSMAPFFIFAVALLVIGAIIACFIRTPKKDEIVVSDEELAESKKAEAAAKAKEFKGWTSKQVLQMKWFWIFSLGFLIIGLGLASLNEDYAAFLDTKLSLTDVGLVGSMYGVGCLIGIFLVVTYSINLVQQNQWPMLVVCIFYLRCHCLDTLV